MEVASLLHTVSSLISHYKPSLINQTACIKLFLSARGQKLHLKNKKVGEKAKMNFKVGNIIISNVFLMCCYAQANTENPIFTNVAEACQSEKHMLTF